MKKPLVFFLATTALLAGCTGQSDFTPTIAPSNTAAAVSPTSGRPPTISPSAPSQTPLEPSEDPPPTAVTEPPPLTPNPSGGIAPVVDHRSVALFDMIPEEYIERAAGLRMVYIDRSVGNNISEALDCLMSPNEQSAPNHCRRTEHPDPEFSVGIQALAWSHPGGYDRSNWVFQEWPDGCSLWSQKVDCFLEVAGSAVDQFDVLSYQLSYLAVDGSSDINDPQHGFFSDDPNHADVYDERAFEDKHPEKVFIYWTTSLARSIGTREATEFNQAMRSYAVTNGKPLFDVSDILSHDPQGNPCFDNRDGRRYDNGNRFENHPDDGLEIPAICPHYTSEIDGGHLGTVSVGKIRVAKAFWVLMAQIAGWSP